MRYDISPSSRPSIRAWYEKFLKTDSLQGIGRAPVSDENVRCVQQTFINSPKKSTRCAAPKLNMNHSTVYKALNSFLKYCAYKLQIIKKITPKYEWILQKEFSINMLDYLNNDDSYYTENIFSDEATFHLSGKVYKENVRVWGTEKLCWYQEHTRDNVSRFKFLRTE